MSGRPAAFNAGGEIFFQINNGISGSTSSRKTSARRSTSCQSSWATAGIRLEVRPKISEIDNSVPLGNELFRTKVSYVDTGVEMQAGQTLALAGLKQTRVKSITARASPTSWTFPTPAAFRKNKEEVEEVELLILVTPEFAEGMEPHEVPMCGPAWKRCPPSNCELYWKGLIEVPACGPCGASDPCVCNAPGLDCNMNGFGPCGGSGGGQAMLPSDGMARTKAYRGGETYQRRYTKARSTRARPTLVPATAVCRLQPLQPEPHRTLPDPAAGIQGPQWQPRPRPTTPDQPSPTEPGTTSFGTLDEHSGIDRADRLRRQK